ncbi:unnamed protein product [Parnassius apollo]|uniref:(apollo) hypothetical protein n=1 Tax=Parnassius apollo TaxID=110799 RepID=A0A8S3XUY0_PARAO|nr:unnamed protein product [Parnassius apollo]
MPATFGSTGSSEPRANTMAIIQSCCCWRSLRCGCYASAFYTMAYFAVTIVIMGHFIEVEERYLSGKMKEPESESFLEPDKITSITVSLNITLLACSSFGFVACVLLIIGVYKDIKLCLLPWIVAMVLETLVEVINVVYLFYLQTIYAMICVISQFQEYLEGRGTAAFDNRDRLAAVQYTVTAQHTTTTSSAPSGRRRSAGKPMQSRYDPEEISQAPAQAISSALSKISRPALKKHVQFPDEHSCIEEATERKSEARVISSLWMELESEAPAPER